MRRRLKKQLTIVSVVAAAVTAFGTGVFLVVFEPPPLPPPPPPTFEPLVVRSVRVFRSNANRLDLVAIVKNPNAHAGVRSADYTFEVRGERRVLGTVPGKTFFLPGQEKPLLVLNLSFPYAATDATLSLGNPEWVVVDPSFRGPSLVPVSRTSTVREGRPAIYQVKGVLANEGELDYLRVEVSALGFDVQGENIGGGRTFVGSLLAGERREFTLSWPLPEGKSVSVVQIYPEVNVFSRSAVQPRGGLSGGESRPALPPRR